MERNQYQNGIMNLQTRMPDLLHAEAKAYAQSVGLSLNGLLMVALRDYLDARQRTRSSGEPSLKTATEAQPAPEAVADPLPAETRPSSGVAVENFKPPKNPRAPCPCGSRQQWRHCHGKGK